MSAGFARHKLKASCVRPWFGQEPLNRPMSARAKFMTRVGTRWICNLHQRGERVVIDMLNFQEAARKLDLNMCAPKLFTKRHLLMLK